MDMTYKENGIYETTTETEPIEVAPSECDFMGLGPMNTVSDFVSELYDALFRDILGDEIMDRPLGSFDRHELFRVMSRIFLQDGNYKIYEQLARKGQ